MSKEGLTRPCALKELFVDVCPWRGSKQRWVIMRCFNPFWAWVDSEKQSWAFAALESLLGIWSWLMCVHLSTGICTDARRWSAAPRHRIPAGCTETRGCCTCHESKILLHIFKNQAILTCPYILSCFLFVVPQCLSVKCVCVWGALQGLKSSIILQTLGQTSHGFSLLTQHRF